MKRIVLKKYDMKYFREELTIHPLNIILLFFISTSTVVFQADLAINFHKTVISFFIISASGIAIYFLIRWIIKDRVKSAILLTAILFITLFFRDIYELLAYSGVTKLLSNFSIFVGELFFAIIIVGLVLAPIIIWLYKTKRKLLKLNSYLNLLTTIFLVIEIIGLGIIEATKVELKNKIHIKEPLEKIQNKPDIYFIILDGYTGFSGLQKYWNFENSELKKFLKINGFFIAEKGKTIYNVTNYSIASTFNMSELNFEADNLYAKSSYLSLANIIQKNIVVEHFYEIGYDFINLSFFDIRDKKKFYEDIYFLKSGNIYQSRSIYGHLYEFYNELITDMAFINLNIFNRLKNMRSAPNKKPKFIYAHIMMPHPPYYFDAEGNKNNSKVAHDSKNQMSYLEQLKYTNHLLMETLKSILNPNRSPPIIVVQGDHGFRHFKEKNKKDVEFSVLSCYYFPGQDYSLFTDSMKTINTFRLIFNKYFNQDFQLLN
ncbi:MAG: sulfatase-like hydrolase/transferase [Ignavibacteria bacterium]|nr:sulfatase-like hydrolase/transferase [Ignavibacteria bacterium]